MNTPITLLHHALASGAVDRHRLFDVLLTDEPLTQTITVHTSTGCAGRYATADHLPATRLAAHLSAQVADAGSALGTLTLARGRSTRMCPSCATGLEHFGVWLDPADLDALKAADRVARALDPGDNVPPVHQARTLTELMLAATAAPRTPAGAYYQHIVDQIPAHLADVHSSGEYRKALLRTCLNGLRHLARHPNRSDVHLAAAAAALAPVFADVTDLADTQVAPGEELTAGEEDLLDTLATRTAWVAARSFECRELYGYALEVDPDAHHRVKVPALVLVSGQLSAYPYWFALDPDTSRWEFATAHVLVSRFRINAPAPLDEHVRAVRAAAD